MGAVLNPHLAINQGLVCFPIMWEGAGDTVFDLSGNGVTGTFADSPQWISGKFGSAIDFTPATNPRIEIDPPSALFTDSATFNVWVRLIDASQTNGFCVLETNGLANHYPYQGGNIYLGIFRDGDRPNCGATLVTLTDWHMLTITASPTAYKVYQNARLLYSGAGEANIALPTSGSAQLGSTDSYKWYGEMDNPALYNRALTAQEIGLLYREPFCGFRWTSIIELASYVAAVGGIPIFRRRRAG